MATRGAFLLPAFASLRGPAKLSRPAFQLRKSTPIAGAHFPHRNASAGCPWCRSAWPKLSELATVFARQAAALRRAGDLRAARAFLGDLRRALPERLAAVFFIADLRAGLAAFFLAILAMFLSLSFQLVFLPNANRQYLRMRRYGPVVNCALTTSTCPTLSVLMADLAGPCQFLARSAWTARCA